MKANQRFQEWIKKSARLALMSSLGLLLSFAPGSMAQTSPTNETVQPQSNEKPANVPPLPAGVQLHKDQNIQGVWLANGFNFKGYQTLYLTPMVFAAIERTNEIDTRTMTMQELPERIMDDLRDTKLFATVTTRSDDVKSGAKALKLNNTIIEYSKGSGAARYFGGHFGGGQPVIKLRGQIFDGDKLVCVFEIKRSGVLHAGRIMGAAMSPLDIQRADINVLARDLAAFFERTAGVQ